MLFPLDFYCFLTLCTISFNPSSNLFSYHTIDILHETVSLALLISPLTLFRKIFLKAMQKQENTITGYLDPLVDN